jgi:hypothetical protein
MLLILLALQAGNGAPPVFHGRSGQKDVALPRIEATARVDGVLDEAVWTHAARLTGFSQYLPVDGRPAEDSSEVLVWYAPDAIWFGVRAFEAHGPVVRATLADRDNISADDHVQILLDTFNDRRRALVFAVNPLGVQQDGVRSEGLAGAAGGQNAGFRFDGVVDLNPDYVYESRGRVTPAGYEIEVRIPFKSLRYQGTATQDWGLQIVRVTQHSAYEDTWTPVVRANASYLIQAGRIVGLTGLRRGLVMDLTPEATARVDGAPTGTDYAYGDPEPALGGTLRWGLTQNLSLTATVNPDFSQVEADVGQVTVNERFALFFPEKRPFFLEGLEQFDTPNALIYMRRIQAPLAGVKLTGKTGRTAIAYLAAVDDGDLYAGDDIVYNLVRLRRDMGQASHVGLAYTDAVGGGGYNRVLGVDARMIWRTIWFSDAQLVGSWTRDLSGVERFGHIWNVTFYDRTGRHYGNHGDLSGISPDFHAGAGFVNRTGIASSRIFNRFSTYGKPGALFEQVTTFIGLEPTWRYDELFKSTLEGAISQTILFTIRGGWGASVNWRNAHLRFDQAAYGQHFEDTSGVPGVAGEQFLVPHGLYNLWGVGAALNTPNRALSAGFRVAYQGQPIFDEASRGRAFGLDVNVGWRPTDALRVEASWVHRRLVRSSDDSRFSIANIPRVKVEYQLSRAIFFRYVGQYEAEESAALVSPTTGRPIRIGADTAANVGARRPNEFRSDVLFSFRPTPGTVLFLGYGASLTEDQSFRFADLRRTADGVFIKASYLFRL